MLGVNHTLLIRWTAKLPALKVARGKQRKSADKGHASQLNSLKFELLAWVFAHREQGIVVTKAQVVFKAFALLHSFGAKTFEARFKAVSLFLERHVATRPKEYYREGARPQGQRNVATRG